MKIPKVSYTTRIFNHRDRILGSWLGDKPANLPPITVEIHLSNVCTFKCKFCYKNKLQKFTMMPEEALFRVCHDLISMNVRSVVLSGGGEPTEHRLFADVINLLASNGIDIGVVTNGAFIDQYILEALTKTKWVKVSLHTSNAKKYKEITGQSKDVFDIVCHNIYQLIRTQNGKPTTSVGCVVCNLNDSNQDIINFVNFACKELSIDYVLFRPSLSNCPFSSKRNKGEFENLIQMVDEITTQHGVFTNFRSFVRDYERPRQLLRGRCPIVWDGLVAIIAAWGEVYPCISEYLGCIQGNLKNSFGSILNRHFYDIWTGSKRRNRLINQRNSLCLPCRYEGMAKIMEELVKGKHIEQICEDKHWMFL